MLLLVENSEFFSFQTPEKENDFWTRIKEESFTKTQLRGFIHYFSPKNHFSPSFRQTLPVM